MIDTTRGLAVIVGGVVLAFPGCAGREFSGDSAVLGGSSGVLGMSGAAAESGGSGTGKGGKGKGGAGTGGSGTSDGGDPATEAGSAGAGGDPMDGFAGESVGGSSRGGMTGRGGRGNGGTAGKATTGGAGGAVSPGTSGAGGTRNMGGTNAVGGTDAMGGTNAIGGTNAMGGGGGAALCSADWAVSPTGYVASSSGSASSCWHGYGFTSAIGPTTTVSPLSFEMCGAACKLCVSAKLVASQANTTGALVGFNVNQTINGTGMVLSPSGTGVSISYSNTSAAPMRLVLQGEVSSWCAQVSNATRSAFIPYTSFNTQCANNQGQTYAKERIRSVSLVATGSTTLDTSFDLCLLDAHDG